MSIACSEVEATVRSSNVLSRLWCLAIILWLPATSAGTTGATIAFKPPVSYPVGTNPVAVAVGDFNGDGKPDLVVVNLGDPAANNDGSVSILFGNGDGTFQAAKNSVAGKNPSAIAVGDFNGDHKLDLAVINADSASGNLAILLGNGDGTFQSPVDYVAGNGPKMVAVGDFNGDHKLDLAIPNLVDGTVSILLGNGDGSFHAHADYLTGGAPQGVVLADLNGDGKQDLAVPIASAGVAILLGNGDGTFQSASVSDPLSPWGPTDVAAGDFNGDGKLDLIVNVFLGAGGCCPINWRHRVDLLAGNGDGTFHLITSVIPGSGFGAFQADFNGDGKLDLLQRGSIFPGNGDGTFQTPMNFDAFDPLPSQVVSEDLNGDKSPDIVMTNTDDNTISVLLDAVSTDFSISASTATPSTVSPGQSATATVSLSLLNAFDNPVSLACTVQPVQAGSPTCSINPNSVTFDSSGSATAQLTVTAGAVAASLSRPPARESNRPVQFVWLPVAGFAAIGAGFGRGAARKKRLLLRMSAFLLAGLMLETACGGGSSGPKFQSYSVTVVASSVSAKHSATVTLKVQ